MRNKAFLKKFFFLSALFSMSFAGVDAEDGYHYYQDGNGVTWKFFVDNEQFPDYAKTTIMGMSGYSSEVTVPAVVYDEDQKGWSVYTIGGGYFTSSDNMPFGEKTDITKVVLSNGIVKIETRAFAECSNLEYIELPESIEELGSQLTFTRCKSLKEIRIPSKVQSVPERGFENCFSLECVDLSNVRSIQGGAFYGCTSLKSVIIPDEVEKIGSYAFQKCTSLASISIPDKVESIGSYAFEKCDSLKSVSISSSVTSIGEKVFSDCYNLNSIIVDPANNVYDSRDNCNAIIETSSNTLIAGSNTTKIPESVTAIGSNAFYGYKLLETIELPENISNIEEDAFAYCRLLSCVVLPKNLSSVGKFAFYACSALESVEISSSVTSIGDHAFNYCNELTQVYSYIAEPFAINSNVFSATTKENATLYVPQGTLDLYKEADGWKEFANIVEMSIGDVEQISSESAVSDVYNLNGQKADALSGINIIRKTDGTTQKVLVK